MLNNHQSARFTCIRVPLNLTLASLDRSAWPPRPAIWKKENMAGTGRPRLGWRDPAPRNQRPQPWFLCRRKEEDTNVLWWFNWRWRECLGRSIVVVGEAIKVRLLDERGSCCSRGARGLRNCYNKLVEDAKLQKPGREKVAVWMLICLLNWKQLVGDLLQLGGTRSGRRTQAEVRQSKVWLVVPRQIDSKKRRQGRHRKGGGKSRWLFTFYSFRKPFETGRSLEN